MIVFAPFVKVLAKRDLRVFNSVDSQIMGANKSMGDSGRGPCTRIFIVDDEPMLLELAERILSNGNYDIQTFNDPTRALKAYSEAEQPPDLLITDFAMHEMDGMDLIRQCRKIHPKQKIILVSGTVDESVFAGSGCKPDRFLAKPYLPAQLSDLVHDVLAH